MYSKTKTASTWKWGVLLALTMVVGNLSARGQGNRPQQVAIAAKQVVACINTAVKAKPGNVQEVAVEKRGGKVICKVSIVASGGKKYEVTVDVKTNKAVGTEAV